MPVFGLLKRHGKVYTQRGAQLLPCCVDGPFEGQGGRGRGLYADGWNGYRGLADLGDRKHSLVDHGRNQFVKYEAPINGLENFWGQAKLRLAKFRGLYRATLRQKVSSVLTSGVIIGISCY